MKNSTDYADQKLRGRLTPFILGYILIAVATGIANQFVGPRIRVSTFPGDSESLNFIASFVRTFLMTGYIFELVRFMKEDEFEITNMFTNARDRLVQTVLFVLSFMLVDVLLNYLLGLIVFALVRVIPGVNGILIAILAQVPLLIIQLVVSYLIVIYVARDNIYPQELFKTRFMESLSEAFKYLGSFFRIDLHYYGIAFAVLIGGLVVGLIFVMISPYVTMMIFSIATLFMLIRIIMYYPHATIAKLHYYHLEKGAQIYDY